MACFSDAVYPVNELSTTMVSKCTRKTLNLTHFIMRAAAEAQGPWAASLQGVDAGAAALQAPQQPQQQQPAPGMEAVPVPQGGQLPPDPSQLDMGSLPQVEHSAAIEIYCRLLLAWCWCHLRHVSAQKEAGLDEQIADV